jgi:hypothetical protein
LHRNFINDTEVAVTAQFSIKKPHFFSAKFTNSLNFEVFVFCPSVTRMV